ncbi:RIB7 [Candida pseudojiufengensis]|uniref:RIB7 n=1 Tax=Candida pseudojiufengensis TaxID=497109 RepID=UPI00222559B7|nr:RIB7 [Candida pseudojiufengensis]KAI5961443.1 RIB7 [Candida pseudojiufengensis]
MSLPPLPTSLKPFLKPYLPSNSNDNHITLTYAQSLDSRIALKRGLQTKISHLETKTMTHYIRSKHQAILVGINTVLVDDPKLNCRYNDEDNLNLNGIRPIIIDPSNKWNYDDSQLSKICEKGEGISPFILIDESITDPKNSNKLKEQGGKYISLPLLKNRKNNWEIIIKKLNELGINSIMIEGGSTIINEILEYPKKIYDVLIITIAPIFLGKEGVEVSPNKQIEFSNVNWWTGIQDSVMCCTPKE